MKVQIKPIYYLFLLILFFLPTETEGFAWFYNKKQTTVVSHQAKPPPVKKNKKNKRKKRNRKPPQRTNFFFVLGLSLLILGGIIMIAAFIMASVLATAGSIFGPIAIWFIVFFFLSSFSLLFLLPGAILAAIGVRYNDRRDGINKQKKYKKQKRTQQPKEKEQPIMTARQYKYNKKKNRPYLGIGIAFTAVGFIFLFAHLLGALLMPLILLFMILLTAVGVTLLINYFIQENKLKQANIVD